MWLGATEGGTGGTEGLVAAGGMRLYPLAGQPLGFGYLFASHLLLEDVFVARRSLISLGCREIEPHIGEHIVLRDAVSAPRMPGG